MEWFGILVLLSCVVLSIQRSTPQDDHYVAAVVEYLVNRNVDTNRENYVRMIKEAADQNVDILVFPELTLTNSTLSFPVPFHGLLKDYPIPALRPDLYHELLVAISAAARDNQIYVLINVRELLNCTEDTGEYCPAQRQYIFNTNVVIDRTGAVIDRFNRYAANSTAIFEELTIIGTVPTPVRDPSLNADDSTFFPVSSLVSILPLEAQDYSYSSVANGNTTTHTLSLNNIHAELYGFALWGRDFSRDGLEPDPPIEETEEEDEPLEPEEVEEPDDTDDLEDLDGITQAPGVTPGGAISHVLSPLLVLVALLVNV